MDGEYLEGIFQKKSRKKKNKNEDLDFLPDD